MAINVELPKGIDSLLRGKDNVELEVRMGDYLNTDFLNKYTKFDTYEEFVEFSPYTEEELANNSDLFNTSKMDRYIELTTQFKSFDEMFSFAVSTKLDEFFDKK